MNREELLRKYHSGTLTPHEEQELERQIAAGHIQLDDLEDLRALSHDLALLAAAEHSPGMESQFRQWLAEEREYTTAHQQQPALIRWLSTPMTAAAMLVLGLLTGMLLTQKTVPATPDQQLVSEVNQLRTDMMLTLLEKKSSSDRLRAVTLTRDLPDVNDQVAEALLTTLRKDANSNVRLAALDALVPFAERPNIRTGLIGSISYQHDPLVLLEMADLMVDLQEKASIDPLEKILERDDTPPEVKASIEESLQILL